MIPFLDLAADFAEVEEDLRRRIDGVLARQQFVLGPETADLEDELRRRLGAAAAIAVSSGSEAAGYTASEEPTTTKRSQLEARSNASFVSASGMACPKEIVEGLMGPPQASQRGTSISPRTRR